MIYEINTINLYIVVLLWAEFYNFVSAQVNDKSEVDALSVDIAVVQLSLLTIL